MESQHDKSQKMKKRLPPPVSPVDEGLTLEGFRAYEIGMGSKDNPDYVRKDFYKICVTDGDFIVSYDDRVSVSKGNILFCGSPHMPYTCQPLNSIFKGYACVFTPAFLTRNDPSLTPENCPLFTGGGDHIISLSDDQNDCIRNIFKKMMQEAKGGYKFRDETIRSYINAILHFAQKKSVE